MGLFKKRATDPAEIERLQAEIAAMGARLNAADAAKIDLDHTVQGIAERLDASTPPPPAPPPPAPPPTSIGVDTSGLDELTERVARLAEQVAETPADEPDSASGAAEIERIGKEVERIGRRLEDVDARITSISTELANQITELGAEVDINGAVPTDAVVSELRDAQTRLAGEQARYQIAFRQDLAELADRLKRS